ncbi:MAG: flagellar filament capping protein FliD [Sulfuricellaceae bacterium]
MAISSPGIGSNLDVNGIVSKLMSVEQQPVTLLNKKEASYQAKLSAYGSLQGAVSSFQSALQGLGDVTKFQSTKATPTDSTVLSASASSIATAGSYSIDVTTLAQSQKLVAAGQTSITAAIGSGAATTLSFDFGTVSGGAFAAGAYTGAGFTSNGAGIKTVTIDGSNNSLAGIKDAINNAKIGVTASIVNDGGASPYRLVLSSDNVGKSNSIKVSVSGDAALSSLLAHDPANDTGQNLSESVTAQNAEFKVNGVAISKTSNNVSDVVQGVTFNLLKAASSTTLSVSQDTASVTSSVNALVTAYNSLNKTLADLTAYDPKTKAAGPLLGDSTVLSIQSRIRRMLSTPLTNPSGSFSSLGQIGVSFQKDGSLAVDSGKLQSAINTNFSDIAGLFATNGKASDSLVSYTGSTANTKPGSYALSVSQLASQGNALGTVDLSAAAPITITTGVDDELAMTVDGIGVSITLGAGTYTADALATEVQSKINGVSALSSAGGAVAVTLAGGMLSISSNRYGSASSVTGITGSAAAALLGAPVSTTGVDVAGTLGGGSATGSGQILTGASGGANGLRVTITGGVTASRGTVSFNQGYAYQLNQLTTSLLSSTGAISSRTSGINASITDIGKRRDELNTRLAAVETRYRAQFTKLDTLISSLTTTSNYLTQQLANIAANTTKA